jgi:hypothetical protein
LIIFSRYQQDIDWSFATFFSASRFDPQNNLTQCFFKWAQCFTQARLEFLLRVFVCVIAAATQKISRLSIHRPQ